jgi:hypothetical protein
MASYAFGEFQHLDLSHDSRLALNSGQVGLNLLQVDSTCCKLLKWFQALLPKITIFHLMAYNFINSKPYNPKPCNPINLKPCDPINLKTL